MKKAIIPILYALVFSFGNVLAGNKPLPKDINSIINQLTLEQKARLLVGCTGSDNGLSHMVAGSAGYTFPIDSLHQPGRWSGRCTNHPCSIELEIHHI